MTNCLHKTVTTRNCMSYNHRLRYLLKTYILLVLTFMAAKVAFMFFNREGHHAGMTDVWDVLRHGLSLDLSTALYFLLVPFLVVLTSIWWNKTKVLQRVLTCYYGLVAIAFALAFVADSSLYPFWGFKLDGSCLQYLTTPAEAFASVSVWYLLLRVLCIVMVSILLTVAYSRPKPAFRECRRRWLTTLLMVALLPLMVIGVRGGLDESTTNIGQVYFSQNQFLNHAAINPVFSFLASFEDTANDNTDYHFMTDSERDRLLANVFPTESVGTDSLLTTDRPNIIVVLMESAGGEFTEIGGRTDIMPNLNRLARQGIYFSNCYGNTWRTDRGTLCTWSGYPSFPTMSVMKMPSKTRALPNIAKTLRQERNYTTHYLYGGDINFTNMRSYLVGGGFAQLTWKQDYSQEEQLSAEWGVRDDITFGTLYDLTTQLQQPFLIGYSTLSSHEPWDVPIRKFDDEILNAFFYLDQCIGRFVDRLKQTALWDNTLIVLLPDHGINYADIDETKQLRNHIPMLWVGGAVKKPRRIEQICNQTDLPATLLAQLQLPHADFRYSRDVLSKNYTYPVAFHTYNNGFSLVDSTGFVVFDLNAQRTIVNESRDAERLVRLGKAMLQSASDDLKILGTNQ